MHEIVRDEIYALRSVFLQEIRLRQMLITSNRLNIKVDYFSVGFVSIYICNDKCILSQLLLQFEYGSGAQGSRISEEETTPRCLSGPSSTSLFPVIFSCVGVGRNVKRCSAGSWDMYWKKGEGSLLSLCSRSARVFTHMITL